MKHCSRTFALFLALVLLLSMAPISPAAHAASTVSFSMNGIFDYEESAELSSLIIDARQEAFLFSTKTDGELNDCAMTRAAEIYACTTPNRPDGKNWKDVLEMPFYSEETVQFYTFADTPEEAYNNL